MDEIVSKISAPVLLEQTAEECNELAHACLKMARKIRNENPTPLTMGEIEKMLCEEIADVMLCMEKITESGMLSHEAIESVIMKKEQRWKERLKEKENE